MMSWIFLLTFSKILSRKEVSVFSVGDRVEVIDQDITGEIVRWDGADAVVLDDDCVDWMEEGDDGTLVFRVSDIRKEDR